jgi:NADPH-dependent curcumin reductase
MQFASDLNAAVFDAVLPLLNIGARVPVCGNIAHYNDGTPSVGPDRLPKLISTVLQRRIRLQGFVILDHYAAHFETFRREMNQWVRAGEVKLLEHVVDGLENAPAAFRDLLEGRSLGKVIVNVGTNE